VESADLRKSWKVARSPRERRELLRRFCIAAGDRLPALLKVLQAKLIVPAAAAALETAPVHSRAILEAIKLPSKSKTLQRLIAVQHRVAANAELDEAIAVAMQRTKYACPKCDARLTRPKMIRHLWFKHKRLFEKGESKEPGPLVEAAIERSLRSSNPRAIDRVYNLTAVYYPEVEPVAIHQAIVARQEREPEDLEPLRKHAREQHAGLCPACLALMPSLVPVLPAPLVVSHGRLSGEGFVLESTRASRRRRRTLLITLPISVLAFVLVCLLPMPWIVLTLFAVIVAGLEYQFHRRARRDAALDDEIVDRAWQELVPRVGRSASAVRFLTRLCRTSLEHGDPAVRTEAVWSQVEQAAVLSGKGGQHLQWFAAVRVLQAADAGHFGKDWIPSLVGLFAPLFRAEASPIYAEAVAGTLLDSTSLTDSDAARLRIALVEEAFANSLSPADLGLLASHCPNLERLLAGNEEWFCLLSAIWRSRDRKRWQKIADAETVFDFAKSPASGRLLAAFPDTLLVQRYPELPEFSPIIIARRGVTIAGKTVGEINTAIEITSQNALRFGPHTIATLERIPRKLPGLLTDWLQYREQLLKAGNESSGLTPRGRAMLAPNNAVCPLCQADSLVKLGDLGTPWPPGESP
jgi:hypothetical protein